MKFNFIQLSWWWRQSLPTSFHESQYDGWSSRIPSAVSMYPKNAGSVLCLLNRTDYYVLLYQKNSWLFVLEMHLISGMTDGGKGCEPLPPGKLNVQSGPLPSLSFGSFFKENVRYPVWTCRNPISVILVTRFSLILGIQFSILGARIGSLKHLKKTDFGICYSFGFSRLLFFSVFRNVFQWFRVFV